MSPTEQGRAAQSTAVLKLLLWIIARLSTGCHRLVQFAGWNAAQMTINDRITVNRPRTNARSLWPIFMSQLRTGSGTLGPPYVRVAAQSLSSSSVPSFQLRGKRQEVPSDSPQCAGRTAALTGHKVSDTTPDDETKNVTDGTVGDRAPVPVLWHRAFRRQHFGRDEDH